MKLTAALNQQIERVTGLGIKGVSACSGGCINNAEILRFDDNSTAFLKWLNDAPQRFFKCEAKGLDALRTETSLRVPNIIAVHDALADPRSEFDSPSFLLLEDISAPPANRSPGSNFDEELGRGLAELHSYRGHAFGWEADNYIGPTPQDNKWVDYWPEFFRVMRLAPMLRRLENARKTSSAELRKFDALLLGLDELLPSGITPSLLHGDLWSGNVMRDGSGAPALIDPAVYFGDPEADLAMTELFGGFSARFRDAYHEMHPRRSGYKDRRDIYNLYHLLNHALLFGGGYLAQALAIAKRFV